MVELTDDNNIMIMHEMWRLINYRLSDFNLA